jgi:hypothetical protein
MIEVVAEPVPDPIPPPPVVAQDDAAEARRQFAERMLRWFDSDECRAAMAEGCRQAEETIRADPLYGLDYAPRS